jgi:hypothetical protein
MSRFDRRLKGVGLRPGQSTCNVVQPTQPMLSMGSNYNSYVSQSPGIVINNNISNEQPDQSGVSIMTEEQLALKTRQLEQYILTAPTQEIKLITGHEIRLNKLEWINAMCEKMCKEEENCQAQASALTPIISTSALTTNDYINLNKLETRLSRYTLQVVAPIETALKKDIIARNSTPAGGITESDVSKTIHSRWRTHQSKEVDKIVTVKVGELDKKFSVQLHDIVKQFNNSIRDISTIKEQISLIGPQMTRLAGLKHQIESFRAENQLLKDDISQLRMTTKEKSGEIVKLTVQEQENLEDEVSKEVSEEVIQKVVDKAIQEKSISTVASSIS